MTKGAEIDGFCPLLTITFERATAMDNCGIYQILNLRNGKFYIGSSIRLNTRKKEHFKELSKGIHHSVKLQRAYNKEEDKSVFVFKVLFYCEDNMLIFYEQRCFDFLKPQYNTSLTAGKIDWTDEAKRKISGNNNVMKRPDVILKHKISVSDPEVRKRMGHSGSENVMNRPEIREKHKKSLSDPEVRKRMGRSGNQNAMSRPEIRKKQMENVRRGENHHFYGLFGELNYMKNPEIKQRHKNKMAASFSGKNNPSCRQEVKDKVKITNSKIEVRKKRSLSQAKINEETVIEILKSNGTINQIAEKFNLSYNTVYPIKKGKTWRYLHENLMVTKNEP